jgi:conjugation system TraG family ATPase
MSAKTLFNIPYSGVDKNGEYDLLIGLQGEYSVIINMTNPVIRYSAYPAGYDEFHNTLINLVKVLGDGYILQKQDIISRSNYHSQAAGEYLQQKYNAHFEGRERLEVDTYLTITRQVKKGAFYVYDAKALRDFRQAVGKVLDILPSSVVLKESRINQLVLQMLSMDFKSPHISLNNLSPSETGIRIGEKAVRNITLVNIDSIDLPPDVGTHIELNEKESMRGFPVDFLSFLFKVPGCDVIIYNQVIEIPNQVLTLRKLELKKKRHSGIPDPANLLCVEDIDLLLNDVARENQLLVTCHFNIMVAAPEATLQKAANFIESSLFQLGIIPSKNAYNQLELFRSALPGNAVELKPYDWFLTTCDAAACFFFKESLPKDEPSDFLIRFTDRQGIPVGMDPADMPMRTGRINNRNKFVLGPSGSGKSFFMNGLIEQYMLYNMDMVIVDTGHSYSGLCSYYSGKYITYTDKTPITMNPFRITEEEYNIEKKDFLCTLIGVAWKGADGSFSPVERDVVANVISAYYSQFFADNGELTFDTFYEFALNKIPEIKAEERIVFDFDEFRYVLKKFYKDGEFAPILNKEADKSLFTERFIVFEIDSIKGAHVMAA